MGKRGKAKPPPPRKLSSIPAAHARTGRVSTVTEQANALIPRIVGLLTQGRLESAMPLIQSGMRLAPDRPEFPHLAGQVMMHSSEAAVAQACRLFEKAVALSPRNPQYLLSLADALRAEGRYEDALAYARKALRLNPRLSAAHTIIGIALAKLNRQREASEALENATRLEPRNADLWLNLALCRMELHDQAGVERAVEQFQKLVPDLSPLQLRHLGNLYHGLGQYSAAEGYYLKALDKRQDADTWFSLAKARLQNRELDLANAALGDAERLGYPRDDICFTRAGILALQGRVADAESNLQAALQLAEDDPSKISAVANELGMLGAFDAQRQCLKRVLEILPHDVDAFVALVQLPDRAVDKDELNRLRRLVDDKKLPTSTRSNIGFALGDALRKVEDYDRSFHYYRLGNQLTGHRFNEADYRHWQSRVVSSFRKALFERRSADGNPSRVPILIVGMPRSGTTLVEQILSAHPAVHGAGEIGTVVRLAKVGGLTTGFEAPIDQLIDMPKAQISEYAENYLSALGSLAGNNVSHVTNKSPHNFQQLGLFSLLFPQAPIIHVKRDPRDNLLSIYFQNFARAHDYACDLKALGRYYVLYEDLMEHWDSVLPNPLLSIQYEDLVNDLPGNTAALAEFVGVDLDERMLAFWQQERQVKTASKWQVRQPIYTSSVGRWRPYERHLKPLFEGLGL